MNRPEIRVDDCLQSRHFSHSQNKAFAVRSPLEWFKLATSEWQDYPLVLSVVAEGIDENPEWVSFIKSHPIWKVECHGWLHRDYRKIDLTIGVGELVVAKKKIEDTFNQKVTKFYPPCMRYSNLTAELCRIAGLELMVQPYRPENWMKDHSVSSFYFHYWTTGHIKNMKEVARQLLAEP